MRIYWLEYTKIYLGDLKRNLITMEQYFRGLEELEETLQSLAA
jgi:hypothetical protein